MIIYGCSILSFGHVVIHSPRSSLGYCASLISFYCTFSLQRNHISFILNSVLLPDRFFLQLGHPHHWHGTGRYFGPSPHFPIQKLSGIDRFAQTQQRGSRGRVREHGAMTLLSFPYQRTFTTPVCRPGWRPKREKIQQNPQEASAPPSGGTSYTSYTEHVFVFNLLFFSFCLIRFTCNIAFKVTREAVNGLLGGTAASFCSSPVLHVCPVLSLLPSPLLPPSFLRGWRKERKKKPHP